MRCVWGKWIVFEIIIVKGFYDSIFINFFV